MMLSLRSDAPRVERESLMEMFLRPFPKKKLELTSEKLLSESFLISEYSLSLCPLLSSLRIFAVNQLRVLAIA